MVNAAPILKWGEYTAKWPCLLRQVERCWRICSAEHNRCGDGPAALAPQKHRRSVEGLPAARTGPPAGRDHAAAALAELVALAVVQALLGRTSEARWLRYARAELRHLLPLPAPAARLQQAAARPGRGPVVDDRLVRAQSKGGHRDVRACPLAARSGEGRGMRGLALVRTQRVRDFA